MTASVHGNFEKSVRADFLCKTFEKQFFDTKAEVLVQRNIAKCFCQLLLLCTCNLFILGQQFYRVETS